MAETLCKLIKDSESIVTLYSASAYAETVTLSRSYKGFRWLVVDYSVASIHNSSIYNCNDLATSQYIGAGIVTTSPYGIYAHIVNNTSIKVDYYTANTYIAKVYGIK